MIEIKFSESRKPCDGPTGLQECPGRNDPRYLTWMLQTLIPDIKHPTIVDPMIGGGQLHMLRPGTARVIGCDVNWRRVEIARANGCLAIIGDAESWKPEWVATDGSRAPIDLDIVAFSPPYPNCDHASGKTEHQVELVRSKGLQSMQAIEQVPCMWRVFAQIATYCGRAPVAVICKNYVEKQVEVDWVSELASSMMMAGLGRVDRYWRKVPTGPTETWKVARGEFSARTGKTHRTVEKEWVLVARR